MLGCGVLGFAVLSANLRSMRRLALSTAKPNIGANAGTSSLPDTVREPATCARLKAGKLQGFLLNALNHGLNAVAACRAEVLEQIQLRKILVHVVVE